MQAIANGLSMLIAKLAAAVKWIGDLFVAVFAALWDILRDVPAWILDQCLGIVVSAVSAVDVSGMQDAGQWFGQLPAEVLNMLGLLGIDYALGIITGAIVIRLTLQLIPFTRLGS